MRQDPVISMHLTLFVPDLFWPDRDDHAAFQFDGDAELARFLSLAEHTTTTLAASASWETVLAETFGIDQKNPPLGAIRLLGESEQSDSAAYDQTLLCADPVNLDFMQQSLVLSCPEADQLHADEAHRLINSLNDEFKGEGVFFSGNSTNHWYFRPITSGKHLPDLAACSRFLGRRIDADASRHVLDRDGLHWLNRIQMCLNSHDVNNERLARGETPVNSVWPWGNGLLPANFRANPAPFDQVSGNSTLLRGLSIVTGIAYVPTITSATNGLLLDTSLATAIAQDDVSSWKKAIVQFTYETISPAINALNHNELTSLALIAPDAHQTHHWLLHSNHKGLRPTLFQRCLGRTRVHPELSSLVNQW